MTSPVPPSRPLKGLFIVAPEWGPHLYGEEERAELGRHIEWVAPPRSAAEIRGHLELLREVEVIFAGWGTAVMDETFMAAAPRLRAVFHAGGTVRYFATEAFWNRDVVVCSGAAINALPVVEYALAAILFSLRDGWFHARRAHRDGAFPPRRPMPGSYGTTVGLVSLGAIARLLCERLRPFDVRLVAHDPFASAADAARLGVELVSLEDVFTRSEVVSLHAPLLPATENMVRGHHFAAMKPGATFINTARGAIVNEPEMIAVLEQRPDLQAVLDVTWPEPPAAGSPLYRLENVVLTPHLAGTTPREARRIGRAMVEDFHRWRRGEPLRHAISREQFARMA